MSDQRSCALPSASHTDPAVRARRLGSPPAVHVDEKLLHMDQLVTVSMPPNRPGLGDPRRPMVGRASRRPVSGGGVTVRSRRHPVRGLARACSEPVESLLSLPKRGHLGYVARRQRARRIRDARAYSAAQRRGGRVCAVPRQEVRYACASFEDRNVLRRSRLSLHPCS